MDAKRESEPTPMKNRTTVERKSERELVVTRTFNGPARIVFEAWTAPSCSSGGGRRGRLACPCFPAKWMFVSGALLVSVRTRWHGVLRSYNEVIPHSRLVWTNDEGGEDGPSPR